MSITSRGVQMNHLVVQQSCVWVLCMELKGKDFAFADEPCRIACARCLHYFISACDGER